MTEQWKRRRRLLLSAAALGAGACGAGYWYLRRRRSWGPPSLPQETGPSPLVESSGSQTTRRMDAVAHLEHHFESIQEIADSTTIPSLLPALVRSLDAFADMDSNLLRLRRSRTAPEDPGGEGPGSGPGAAPAGGSSPPLSTSTKVGLWEELKVTAFSRAAAVVWLLPLLSTTVHVQLSILGRHLYLESALVPTPGPACSPPARLSSGAQEQFLSLAEHLSRRGAKAVLESTHAAARRAVQAAPLHASLSPPQMAALLSDALREAALALGPLQADWTACIFASEDPAAAAAACAPPAGPAAPAADEAAIADMTAELTRVVSSRAFASAVREGAAAAAAALADGVKARVPAGGAPLAKLVPAVAAAAAEVLGPEAGVVPALARTPAVRDLCAAVYACAPLR